MTTLYATPCPTCGAGHGERCIQMRSRRLTRYVGRGRRPVYQPVQKIGWVHVARQRREQP